MEPLLVDRLYYIFRKYWKLCFLVTFLGAVGTVLVLWAQGESDLRTLWIVFWAVFLFPPLYLWSRASVFSIQFGPTAFSSSALEMDEAKDDEAPSVLVQLEALDKYYRINQGQARGSFSAAVWSMVLGTGLIIGAGIYYIQDKDAEYIVAVLGALSGFIVNILAGVQFKFNRDTQQMALTYYEQLVLLQRAAVAIKLMEQASDGEQAALRIKIVDSLLQPPTITPPHEARQISPMSGH